MRHGQSVQPEFVIISTGGLYGHPTKKAYESFLYPGLAKVTLHSVFIGGLSPEGEVNNYVTDDGIFSTFPHGDIKVVFPETRSGKIKIISQNSTTKEFEKIEEQKEERHKAFQGDLKELPSDVEKEKQIQSINDIADPESYNTLIEKIQNKKGQILPLAIDLKDPRNQFIFDYLHHHKQVKDQEASIQLRIDGKLVGVVFISLLNRQEKTTDFMVDLKDPRNLHLLQSVRVDSGSNTPIISPTGTANPTHSTPHTPPTQEQGKERELKKPKIEPAYTTGNLSLFLTYLSSTKNQSDQQISEKLEPNVQYKASTLKKLMSPNPQYRSNWDYTNLWKALKEKFKDDFDEWAKTQ